VPGAKKPTQWPHEQWPCGAMGLAEAQRKSAGAPPQGAAKQGAPVPGAKKPTQWPHEQWPCGAMGLAEAQRNKAAAGARDGAAAAAAAETAAIDAAAEPTAPAVAAAVAEQALTDWHEAGDSGENTLPRSDAEYDDLCKRCWEGNLDEVKAALHRGADVNHAGDDGRRLPLIEASQWGHLAVVRLLLAQEGVDVNRADDYGDTPLQVALNCQQLEVVTLLEAAGAVGGW